MVTIGRHIGTGSFKDVYEGKHGGNTVAVLRFRSEGRRYPREAVAIGAIGKHEHITAFMGAIEEPKGWKIIAEYAPFGALDQVLELQPESVHLCHKLAVIHQISHALAAVAEANFVHADVAARNVLVHELSECRCVVKLTDFGSAVRATTGCVSQDQKQMAKKQLALRWASPEVAATSRFSHKSDVWSLGVLGWECFQPGLVPYADITDDDVLTIAVRNGLRPARPVTCPPIVWSELLLCWDAAPDVRPSALEVAERTHCIRSLVAQSEARGKPLPSCTVAQVMSAVDTLGTLGTRTDDERAQVDAARRCAVSDAVDGPCRQSDAASITAASLMWLAADFVSAKASATTDGIDPTLVEEDFKYRFCEEEVAFVRLAKEAHVAPPRSPAVPEAQPPARSVTSTSQTPSGTVTITKPTSDAKFGIEMITLTPKHRLYEPSFHSLVGKCIIVDKGANFQAGLWHAYGLEVGQVITAINGTPVTEGRIAAAMLQTTPADAPITFDIPVLRRRKRPINS